MGSPSAVEEGYNEETYGPFFLDSSKEETKHRVAPATTVVISKAVSWVTGEDIVCASATSVHKCFAEFIEKIGGILNQPRSVLLAFVQERE